MTVRDYMNIAKSMQTSVKGYVDDIAMQNEDLIINLNVTKMQSGYGTNDKLLEYPFDDYSGKYTPRAVAESLKKPSVLPKVVNAKYNFGWTGTFLANFKVRISNENKLEVYSTGTGTGKKNDLLTQTEYMYGLNAEDTRKLKFRIIYKMIEYYDSIEVLPLYNWDRYTTTRDNNWFIIDFNGRQPKTSTEELTALETKLQEEYFKAVDDRTFVKKLYKWGKIDNLTTRYNTIAMIVQRMSYGFTDNQMDLRAEYINLLNKFGFNIPLMNTEEGDMDEITNALHLAGNIKTQIEMLESELKSDEKKQTFSLNKQMVLVSLGLGLAYKIDAKQTSVSEWIELCKLLEEKNAQQEKTNK